MPGTEIYLSEAAISAFQKGLLSQLSTCVQQWLTGIANLAGMIVKDDNSIVIYHYFFQSLDENKVTLQSEHLQRCGVRFGHLFFFRSFGTIHYQRILIRTKSHEIIGDTVHKPKPFPTYHFHLTLSLR